MLKVINDVTRIFILCITTLYPLIRKKTMKNYGSKKETYDNDSYYQNYLKIIEKIHQLTQIAQ